MQQAIAADRHAAFAAQNPWPPNATLTYDSEGTPWGLLPQGPDLLLVARLDILDAGACVLIERGKVGPCSCDNWDPHHDCQHTRLARGWAAENIPGAVRSAAALAADALAYAHDGHPAQALRLIDLAERLAAPHAEAWAAARTVLDSCEEARNLLVGLAPEGLA
jgi:hypothetical protein